METHANTRESALHEKIRAAGLRLTLPRRAICTVLAHHPEEFLTIPDIMSAVERDIGPIDPSTAYRTLDEFARIGLVHLVNLGNKTGRWHLTLDHDHQHLVCEVCGETTLVPTEEVQPMFDTFRDKYGFTASMHHFAILGCCDSCTQPEGHPHT